MKIFLPIILILIISCQNEDRIKPPNFIEKEIVLQESCFNKKFSKVNMFIPIEYDTLLNWNDFSDCGCCGIDKYRLTNSKGCLIKEAGFFHLKYCKDSIDRLTIQHGELTGIDTLKLDDAFFRLELDKIKYAFIRNGYPLNGWKVHKNEQQINGKPFIIVDYFGRDSLLKNPYTQIVAMTMLKKTLIKFNFECKQNDCANFSKKAHQIIKSIQIDTLSIQ